jgi:hypothetical protein
VPRILRFVPCLPILTLSLAAAQPAKPLPKWTQQIRQDHPRLFFNQDSWTQVKARALGQEKVWYERTKKAADNLATKLSKATSTPPKDYGPDAARTAFVYLMTGEERYLTTAKQALDLSLQFYDACFKEQKSVNWYSTSRVHATMALDWLFNDLNNEEREHYLGGLVRAVQNVLSARPRIYRENYSGHTTGYYGIRNCKWFLGCTGLGTGIESDRINEWLVAGYNDNMALLQHRKRAGGDDGGGASPTLGYVFGAYPWSEQNFFYTWLSATGENIAPDWPHGAWLANYVIWNWVETGGKPLEFGWGDTPHTTNRLPTWQLYTHMANIRHLYGAAAPEAAALARHLQSVVPEKQYSSTWFIYPFLLTTLEQSPPPFEPETLPHARHFDNMGQIFMRSGTGADDTYACFTAGGLLSQHRHFDALNVVIYHGAHLALDSGTRHAEKENGQHLKNYYAQTVAHNCVLVHQPGEPAANYWGEGPRVAANHGGQHKQLGSDVEAFETNDQFVYVAGDATKTYHHSQPDGLPQKVSEVTRQIVFIMPSHFVIFDRVTATDPAYRKQWLLHTAHRPNIDGLTAQADHGKGRMFCRTLLPGDAGIELVGGPDNAFQAAGRNWSIDPGKLKPEALAMMGQWRLEVNPGEARRDDVFLHVIQIGSQELARMSPVELLETDTIAGARIDTGDESWEITFAKTGELAGHVKATGKEPILDRPLIQTVTPQKGIVP